MLLIFKYLTFKTEACTVRDLLFSLVLPLWRYGGILKQLTTNPLGDRDILFDSQDSVGSGNIACHPWLRLVRQTIIPKLFKKNTKFKVITHQ